MIRIVVAVIVGVILGFAVTTSTLDRSHLGEAFGPWHGAPHDSAGEPDPYALAATARASLLPLGSSEGLSFIAEVDSGGAKLDGACDYVVAGPMPQTRFWTLSLLTPAGFPVAGPSERYAYTSSDVLRFVDQPLAINVSRAARSGNWLPTGAQRAFVLMLRLYDTGLSTVGSKLDAAAMPQIRRVACS